MCFSATASFTAGAILVGIGTLTLRRATRRSELPYAAIPMLFGVQQLVEGSLWLTISDGSLHLNTILTHIYSLFSHVLWPIFVPLAVMLLETVPWRRTLLKIIAVGGALSGLYLLYFWAMDPTIAKVVGRHITYVSPHFFIGPVLALYIVGTCGSSLLSSHPRVRLFGAATLISLVSAYAFYAYWFISVWCFFAAAMSVVVLLYFRDRPAGAAGSEECARA